MQARTDNLMTDHLLKKEAEFYDLLYGGPQRNIESEDIDILYSLAARCLILAEWYIEQDRASDQKNIIPSLEKYHQTTIAGLRRAKICCQLGENILEKRICERVENLLTQLITINYRIENYLNLFAKARTEEKETQSNLKKMDREIEWAKQQIIVVKGRFNFEELKTDKTAEFKKVVLIAKNWFQCAEEYKSTGEKLLLFPLSMLLTTNKEQLAEWIKIHVNSTLLNYLEMAIKAYKMAFELLQIGGVNGQAQEWKLISQILWNQVQTYCCISQYRILSPKELKDLTSTRKLAIDHNKIKYKAPSSQESGDSKDFKVNSVNYPLTITGQKLDISAGLDCKKPKEAKILDYLFKSLETTNQQIHNALSFLLLFAEDDISGKISWFLASHLSSWHYREVIKDSLKYTAVCKIESPSKSSDEHMEIPFYSLFGVHLKFLPLIDQGSKLSENLSLS